MKKFLISIVALYASLIFANPVWVQYEIKVDNPQSTSNIINATDKFMASRFVQENFKGSLHLNAWIANGHSEATHGFAVLQPSLTAHTQWVAAMNQSKEGQEFGSVLRENSSPVFQRINSFLETYGSPSNEDTYWEVHEFSAKPSDVNAIARATQKMDQAIKADFPGQFGLSAVSFGSGEVTHLLTVGFSSIAELEAWEDSVPTNKAVQKWLKTLDSLVEWKGSDVLMNAKVYDSASDLETFVTKDFE